MSKIPDKPSIVGLESAWSRRWDEAGLYRFDRTRTRAEVYSIDTPPPTVSGSLHVGHVFSYTHTDILARYQRMRGREVFYPMGWDDNGLPTERRVQYHFGVRCDPALPYDPDLRPPATPGKHPLPISRRNFIELCVELTAEDERTYEALWRLLGLSVDWDHTYTTIGEKSRRVSQRAFLRALERGEAYQSEAPTAWDTDFGTAVAQAEQIDKEVTGAYHTLRFGDLTVATTRPELLPACVALVAHPDDDRYQNLFGTSVSTPIFGETVTIHPHPLADPAKGTGLVMVCTFGDATDVLWWRELKLETRTVIGRDGRFTGPDLLRGLTVHQARRRVVELLRESGDLVGEPTPTTHPVRFFEKGDRPLEIVSSRQWFIRTLAAAGDLLARGRELTWHPESMRTRYEDWVTGLNSDWLISRQRFFGVPLPLWYPIGPDGTVHYDRPITPAEDTLPIDPAGDVPPGYTAAQRGHPGGFLGDPDVMDTWATSSLTPQIACGWGTDEDLYARTYPMDLRPQAKEIIRTWLFTSVLRAQQETGALPWRHAAISGWILDPDRKKMGKSTGNGLGSLALFEEYGADAVRYWAANGRPGVDTAFEPGQMRIGRRLAIKLLNASRFVLGFPHADGEATEPLDVALLARLDLVVAEATAALDGYDYARALAVTEEFFWLFCDHYVELVKDRAYAGSASASVTLRTALSAILRLLAPVLPYVTEEVWSWWREGSVHRADWPAAGPGGDTAPLEAAVLLISAVRRAKSEARLSMRAEVSGATVTGDAHSLAAARAVLADVKAAGRVASVTLEAAAGVPLAVTVTL